MTTPRTRCCTIWLLLLMLACIHPMLAQEGVEEIDNFDDAFADDELPYVGLGLGYTPTMIFMNLDELNKISGSFLIAEFSGPLILHGGTIAFTPIFIRNVRVGFYAAGGFKKLSRDFPLGGSRYTRTLRFGVRFMGGGQFDYAFPVTRTFTILPGAALGWGSYSLDVVQSRAGSEEFANVVNENRFRGDTADLNRSVRMLNSHGFFLPAVHFELAPSSNVMVRLSAGYHLGILGGRWVDEGETEFTDVPDINADGPVIQIGVFFGLFQQ